jgi:hypothetical protein
MRPFRRAAWGWALVLLAASAGSAEAAWCNVFQVCCFGCRSRSSSVAFYGGSDPCCNPCPQTVCTTRYVQRCYYQPVTTYQTRTYYEPVTTYRTSYFWEPVTSYRVSCYFDPCTCSYQQVACPTTSYRLRSQCCPVQSFVQRCCSVPVTSYRQAFYYEPVTTCCTTSVGAPVASVPPCDGQPGVGQPGVGQPGVGEQRSSPQQPGVGEYRSSPPPSPPPNTKPNGVSFRQPPLIGAQPPRNPSPPPRPAPPPAVKLERIVYAPGPNVEGAVVRADNAPRPGARLLFVRADRPGERETTTADSSGQFRVTLASGGWLVYVESPDGQPVFDRKIDVTEDRPVQVRLTSR